MTIMEKIVTVAVTTCCCSSCACSSPPEAGQRVYHCVRKSPLQKSKINFKDFRRRAIIVIAAMDIFISLMVFFPGLAP